MNAPNAKPNCLAVIIPVIIPDLENVFVCVCVCVCVFS